MATRPAVGAVLLLAVGGVLAGCGDDGGVRLGAGVERVSAFDPSGDHPNASARRPAVIARHGNVVDLVWIGPVCAGSAGDLPGSVTATFSESLVTISLDAPSCGESESSGNPRGLRVMLDRPVAQRDVVATMHP